MHYPRREPGECDRRARTPRAHELGTTGDGVVIYFERDGRQGQCTVVTERTGRRAGERIVRGREDEAAARRVSG